MIILSGALVIAILLGLAAWNLHISSRFHKVTMAQWQRASAYHALTAARLAHADPVQAWADAAAADEAVRQAEARLPRRSKATRKYFASKEAS